MIELTQFHMYIIHLLDRAKSDIQFVLQIEASWLCPMSVPVWTTNRLAGKALSNKCFMPKELNNIPKVNCVWKNLTVQINVVK